MAMIDPGDEICKSPFHWLSQLMGNHNCNPPCGWLRRFARLFLIGCCYLEASGCLATGPDGGSSPFVQRLEEGVGDHRWNHLEHNRIT